jgi:hypothetical protein
MADQAIVELYEELGKPLPANLRQQPEAEVITVEYAIALP